MVRSVLRMHILHALIKSPDLCFSITSLPWRMWSFHAVSTHKHIFMLLGFLLGWWAFQPQSGSVSKKAFPLPAALTLNPQWELSLSKLCCPWNGLMCPVEFFRIKIERSEINLGNIYRCLEACFTVLVMKLRCWLVILYSHFSFSSQYRIIPDAASEHAKPSGVIYASVWWNLLQYSQEQHCTAGQHLQHLAIAVRPGPGSLTGR